MWKKDGNTTRHKKFSGDENLQCKAKEYVTSQSSQKDVEGCDLSDGLPSLEYRQHTSL